MFSSRYLSFWPMQLAGWGVYLLINILSSIPYRHRPDYIAFRGAFLAASLLAAFPCTGCATFCGGAVPDSV